jgi:hypothetical protein
LKNVSIWLLLFAIAACLLEFSGQVSAAPVTAGQAQSVVRNWLDRNRDHLDRTLNQSIAGVTTYSDTNGSSLYHVVSLSPSGFVVVPADDRIEPIVCFSSEGKFDDSALNPLVALLGRDVHERLSRAAASKAIRNHAKWQSLLSEPQIGAHATSLALPSDVWVEPVVQTQWNQGYPSDVECYNYYTPDHYYTGCVATALAQLMRFWQWPQTGVGNASMPIYINGTASTWPLRGGDGNGGAYNWAEMPLTPDTDTLTTAQYDEVGDLSADAGVAVDMQYGPSGSGAYMSSAQSALVTTFDYSNAIISDFDPSYSELEQQIYPDLDWGMPVVLAISNASEGHCVLADGYGEDAGTFYTHLNVGWGTSADGVYDLWYNLSDPDITNYDFNVIEETIYNVYTHGTGETVSGMVLNAAGSFISGVTVNISGGGVSESTTSSTQHGIYAFTGLPSNTQYTISATYQGQPVSITPTTGQSSSYGSCGNLWAQNLVFGDIATFPQFTPPAGNYSSAQSVTITDATSDSTIYYTVDGSSPTTSSTKYTVPITTVSSGNETISAIATAPGYTASGVGSALYTIGNPAPALSSISPTSATAGSGQFTITATGSNFVSGSVVKWKGSALSTTYVSSTQLTATAPASLITTPGTASVTVYTATPGGGTSSAQTFTINNPVPVLSSINSNSTTAGTGQFTLTATGSSFESDSVVKWNGTALSTSFVSATQLTATVPASLVVSATTASVTVFTPTPGGGTTSAAAFTVTPSVTHYTLTASAGDNGSISPSGAIQVDAGSSPQFTASPDFGCQVSQWTLDGEVVQAGGSTFTVSTVEANHAITVSFKKPGRFDFNGDGMDDLLWENSLTDQLAIWDMDGPSVLGGTGAFTTLPSGWQVNAVADINGDGHPDLLLWNSKTGQIACWELNGPAGTTMLAGYNIATVALQWQPVSMADFNGAGYPDILFENTSTSQLAIWYMNGVTPVSGAVFTTVPSGWRVAGTADFNQDGHPDILLSNTKTGAVAVWYMGGAGGVTLLSGIVFTDEADLSWQIVSTGDLNGDGHPDITWHNTATGQVAVWLMGGPGGTTIEDGGVVSTPAPALAWNVVGVR